MKVWVWEVKLTLALTQKTEEGPHTNKPIWNMLEKAGPDNSSELCSPGRALSMLTGTHLLQSSPSPCGTILGLETHTPYHLHHQAPWASRRWPVSFSFLFSPPTDMQTDPEEWYSKNNKMFYTHFCIYNWTTFYVSFAQQKIYKHSALRTQLCTKKRRQKYFTTVQKIFYTASWKGALWDRRKVCVSKGQLLFRY